MNMDAEDDPKIRACGPEFKSGLVGDGKGSGDLGIPQMCQGPMEMRTVYCGGPLGGAAAGGAGFPK